MRTSLTHGGYVTRPGFLKARSNVPQARKHDMKLHVGGAHLVRTEKVRTGKCQNKKLEKVITDFVLTVLVPKQENVRTEDVRKEFVLTV